MPSAVSARFVKSCGYLAPCYVSAPQIHRVLLGILERDRFHLREPDQALTHYWSQPRALTSAPPMPSTCRPGTSAAHLCESSVYSAPAIYTSRLSEFPATQQPLTLPSPNSLALP